VRLPHVGCAAPAGDRIADLYWLGVLDPENLDALATSPLGAIQRAVCR
jgi:hypothetical protein